MGCDSNRPNGFRRAAPLPPGEATARVERAAASRAERVEHEIAMEMKLDAQRLPTTSQQARLREARRQDEEDRRDAQAEHEALELQSCGRL